MFLVARILVDMQCTIKKHSCNPESESCALKLSYDDVEVLLFPKRSV